MIGFQSADTVSQPVTGESDEAYETRQLWLQDVGGWAYASAAVAGVGVVALGTGIVLEMLQPKQTVALVPTGNGLALAGRW